MFKVPKQSYTAEFKVAAVQRVEGAIVESGVCGVGMRQEKAVAIEGECCFLR